MSPSLLFLCAFCISATWSIPPNALEEAELHFENFIQEHGKQYADENEKQARFQIFKDNLEEAIRMNEKNEGIVYAITQFMDLTREEFQKSLNGFRPGVTDYGTDCTYASDTDIQNVDAPDSFDWRTQNAVTPIRNQLRCGSCYAFSSIGNIESQYAIKHKQQIDLSEQQVVDCDKRNNGCGGGLMSSVFRSLIEIGGSDSENAYPYSGTENSCQFNPSQVQAKLADCRSYSLTSQEKLKELLYTNGPISIAIRASNLQKYGGGIVSDEECTGDVNHAVLLVGYGTENGRPFWIVKNSWGTSWGEQGYLRMQRGETAQSCGMMNGAMATAILA